MTDTLLLLLILGAVNHQLTHILTTGVIFEDFRQWVAARFGAGSKMAYLVRCHLCAGTWMGLAIAAVTSDAVPLASHPFVNFALVSFAVALVGRVWNEVLALAFSGVSLLRVRVEQPQPPVVPAVAAVTSDVQTVVQPTPCTAMNAEGVDDHLLLWTNVPRGSVPLVGDALEQCGQTYEVIRVERAPQGDAANVLCEPYYIGDFFPKRVIVMDERTGELQG